MHAARPARTCPVRQSVAFRYTPAKVAVMTLAHSAPCRRCLATDGANPVPQSASATWRLSGFGDEIDPDPHVQIAVLQALGARHIEVRSAWGVNVADLDDAQVRSLAQILR